MADLYLNPVLYGIEDVTVPSGSGSFPARIYYPSDDGAVWSAPLRDGSYPLLAFAHGDRSGNDAMCPKDKTHDYQAWDAVLHLLARCGFVVIAPAMHDVLVVSDAEAGPTRLAEAVAWMRTTWSGRATLEYPPSFQQVAAPATHKPVLDAPSNLIRPPRFAFNWPTPLGLIGHSWGAKACARLAVRGQPRVQALATIAGTFDENDALIALVDAKDPTLMLAGSADLVAMSYILGLWSQLSQPKHQAAVGGLGHWDWFGGNGGIQPCDPDTMGPMCPVGWQIASELVLGFMTRHLKRRWQVPPHLLGDTGERRPIFPFLDSDACCGVQVRWDDPTTASIFPTPGIKEFGMWCERVPF